MKIHAIRIADVGLFREPIAVEGLTGGLDVLVGPNEAGKSTIFRALEAVFLRKHTTTGSAIEALSPSGGGAPLVAADFQTDAGRWRITKRFGRGRGSSAVLEDLATRRMVARGADAEERLAALLGLDASGGGRFGLLWVAQQQSLVVPQPDFDPVNGKFRERGERQTLQQAIEQEVQQVAGGSLARGVEQRARAALDALVQTKQKQPRKGSAYQLALEARDKAHQELARARHTLEEGESRAAELVKLIAQREQDCSAARLAMLRSQAEDARLALDRASRRTEALARLAAEAEATELACDKAIGAFDVFDEALRQAAELAEVTSRKEREAQSAASVREQAEERQQRSAARVADLRAQERHAADAASRKARSAAEANRLETMRQRLANAQALALEADGLRADLGAMPVTAERLSAIEAAREQLAVARASAPGVEIAFELLPAAVGHVTIDGRPVGASERRPVLPGTRISIAGVGDFTVQLAGAEAGAIARAPQEAADALAELLRAAGAADVGAVRRAAEARVGLAGRLREVELRLASLAPAGVRALEAETAALAAALDLEAGDAGTVGDADAGAMGLDELRAALDEAETAAREDDRAWREAREAEQRLHAWLKEKRLQLAALDARLGPPETRLAQRQELEATKRDRATALDAARTAWDEARALSPTPAEMASMGDAAARTSDAVKEVVRIERGLSGEISRLEGAVGEAGEAEAERMVRRLEDEIARLDEEITNYERDISALELLLRLMAEEEVRIRDRFLAPVVQRIRGYLDMVFPGAELTLTQGFVAAGLRRGAAAEPIDVLSSGTREQIAVLVRLAFGRLLADTGRPVPLILDDALVYSDDERIAAMFGALEAAARHHQVLAFSCRTKAFAGLRGNRLELVPWRQAA
ncbi:MAG: AAA family ATPase [Hyphomicrobiaceae bacterium]